MLCRRAVALMGLLVAATGTGTPLRIDVDGVSGSGRARAGVCVAVAEDTAPMAVGPLYRLTGLEEPAATVGPFADTVARTRGRSACTRRMGSPVMKGCEKAWSGLIRLSGSHLKH